LHFDLQSYPALGNWVHVQRVGYKLLKEGRETNFTAEKALKLSEVGFEFTIHSAKCKPVRRRDLYNPHPHLARKSINTADTDNNNLSINNEGEELDDEEGAEDEEENEGGEEFLESLL
jgi:hypothetical protein